MKIPISWNLVLGATCTATLLCLSAIADRTVFAQEGSSAPQEEITIVAPHLVQRKVVGRTAIGAPVEVISLPRPVSYADLDLTKPADADELRKRISETAKAACKQLDNMYPEGNLFQAVPSDQNCVKTATREAMDIAEQVIAGANESAKK
jgi:UrcA family protein